MPNRIVREGILDSERVNKLSWSGEVFYRRLMSVVDDFGRFDGRAELLRSKLFPLRIDKVSVADVEKWLTECVGAGLVSLYCVNQKPYLELLDFGQSIRIMKSKFPPPEIICTQMQADEIICMSESNPIHIESISNTKSKEKEKHAHASSLILEPMEIERRLIEEEYSVMEFICKTYGFTENQYAESVKMFVGEKTAGQNDLDKDFADVLRHYKSWIKFNAEKIKRRFVAQEIKKAGSKVDDLLTANEKAKRMLHAEDN
jgi:hypothetical protein